MSNDRLKYLLEQYVADASTPAETKEFFQCIRKSNDDAVLKNKIKQLWSDHGNHKEFPEVDWDKIYSKIIRTPVIAKRHIWPQIAAAAAVIILFATGIYLIFKDHSSKEIAQAETPHKIKSDIAPGGNKAILTLANGRQISLESTANGALTQQGNVKIIKLDSGRLAYKAFNGKPGEVLYNTISTPRGGQYQVVLSDGTKVWLNAASSLHFPTSFTGNVRNVQLTGEGYFEVAHNAKKPFCVNIGDMKIQVLGTHFNINAYDDESVMKTTLLEGSIRVSEGAVSKMIRPGEQAILQHSQDQKGSIKIINVDVDAVVAWKNGRFIFQGNNIQSVMRQLARWYDVNVSYQGHVTNELFVGVLNRSRYENISEILDMLEKTRTVSFAINGRNVTVKPFKK
jgi:ferric-dicitrate binding protein FerR (iron transport regulator)